MNIKALRESFMILTLPLLVYGQVSINPSGSVTDGESYTLACTITSFTGTATWTKDGSSLTICTATFCTVPDIDDYKFSSNASGIQVVMYPVSSSIDGLWECAASGNIQQINVTSTRSLISATPSSATTVDMESSFLAVTESILMLEVTLSFKSTDVMLEPTTALTTYALSSLKDSISSTINPSSPLSTNESLETTELPNSEYKKTEKEVDSNLFSLQTFNFSTETITSSVFNEDISTAMLSTEISLQDDSTNSPEFSSITRKIDLDTQSYNTEFFSSLLLYTNTINIQTDLFQSTLTSRHDVQSINAFSLEPSSDSFFVSSVRQDEYIDTFSLSIQTSPVSEALQVYTSSINRIHTSFYQLPDSQTEFMLIHSLTSGSYTSFDSSGSDFESPSSSVGQIYSSVGSFFPFETFLMPSFSYSSSLSQVQPVFTSISQTLFFDLSSLRQTVESIDISVDKIVISSESSSINAFKSFTDSLTMHYTDRSANESISNMVDQSLHLSSLNELVAVASENFDGNSQFLQFTGTPLSNQNEFTTSSSVKYLTQSDLLSEYRSEVNISVSKSSHAVEVSHVQSADSFSKSTNGLSVDIFTLQQTGQTLSLSTYGSIKYDISSTTEKPFNTSLNQFPEGSNQPFGTSSVSIKFSTNAQSTTFHDVPVSSPSLSLIFASFTQLSSFSRFISTNINNVAISNINSIESSNAFHGSSSPSTFRPTQTPELSFRKAQIIIMSSSFAAVILVVLVSLMVMYYLRKLSRGKIQNDNYKNTEIDGISKFGCPRIFNKYNINNHPVKGKTLPLRYHSRSLSNSLYTCDFENNWNSVTC